MKQEEVLQDSIQRTQRESHDPFPISFRNPCNRFSSLTWQN